MGFFDKSTESESTTLAATAEQGQQVSDEGFAQALSGITTGKKSTVSIDLTSNVIDPGAFDLASDALGYSIAAVNSNLAFAGGALELVTDESAAAREDALTFAGGAITTITDASNAARDDALTFAGGAFTGGIELAGEALDFGESALDTIENVYEDVLDAGAAGVDAALDFSLDSLDESYSFARDVAEGVNDTVGGIAEQAISVSDAARTESFEFVGEGFAAFLDQQATTIEQAFAVAGGSQEAVTAAIEAGETYYSYALDYASGATQDVLALAQQSVTDSRASATDALEFGAGVIQESNQFVAAALNSANTSAQMALEASLLAGESIADFSSDALDAIIGFSQASSDQLGATVAEISESVTDAKDTESARLFDTAIKVGGAIAVATVAFLIFRK